MDSQAIVNTMEVLETKPISELVTEATIKVCYVSETENPNQTVINKEVGRQIAATLPGAPVVGFFDEATGDFVEHSRKIEIKDGQVVAKDITRPYGFVSFDQPWYQDFMEDGVVRTYLMCKAYLWTRQYAEASLALNKGQSMELNENSMSGYYEGDVFVFTQATLDKLCILGDAYAPCFAGAKIMSTYARQYNDFTERVEDIIGRRYYVMNGKLEPKPEKITLEYALQLGWNLTDAVYMQLHNRGCDNYDVQGIYSDGGQVFAIIQDRTSLEFLRCDLEITGQDTVVLGTEMIAVSQTWTPKSPAEPEPTPSLGGDTVAASQDPAATLSTTPEPAPAPQSEPAPAGVPASYSAEPAAEPQASEPVAAEPQATEPVAAAEPAAEPTATGEPATNFTADPPAADPAPVEPTASEPVEPAADPAPVVDYAALSEQVENLKQELAAKDEKISSLENELSTYKSAEAEAVEQKKTEMLQSYSALLTEEEMKPIADQAKDLTLEALEGKLAVTYTRKQQAEKSAAPSVQVNIGSIGASADDGLPNFMKQAMEIDKQLHGGITLKA